MPWWRKPLCWRVDRIRLPGRAIISVATLCLSMAVLGCSNPAVQNPDKGVVSKKQDPCPDVNEPLDLPECAAMPDTYGSSPNQPLEYGDVGQGKSLWRGRMMCQSGTIPELTYLGAQGKAPVVSSSPLNPDNDEDLDILDKWSVQCPDEAPVTLYHNRYRCGSPCPPLGMRLIPAKAFEAYTDSHLAYQQNDPTKALTKAANAYAQATDAEMVILWYAFLLNEAQQHALALAMYNKAQKINASNALILTRRVETMLVLRRHDDAAKHSREWLRSMPPDDALRPYLLCLHATALIPSRPKDAASLARLACEQGEASCCI